MNSGLIQGDGHGPEGVDPTDAARFDLRGNEAINLVGDWADSLTNSGTIGARCVWQSSAMRLCCMGQTAFVNGPARRSASATCAALYPDRPEMKLPGQVPLPLR